MTFEQMWHDLAPVGRSASSGGYFRQPFGAAERECHAWFLEQCARRDLDVESDGNGNTVAWWRPATGIVPDVRRVPSPKMCRNVWDYRSGRGGDRVAPRLGARRRGVRRAARRGVRARGGRPAARAGVPPDPADRGGGVRRGGGLALRAGLPRVAAGDRHHHARRRPASCATATAYPSSTRWRPPASSPTSAGRGCWTRSACFVELHVEQGRDLVDRDAAVGVASEIWPHGRYRFDFTGEANHAGTTRMEDRHDPMLTYAMTALAANKQARLAGQRATFGRVDVAPNGTNAVPSRVTAWLDARCATDADARRAGRRDRAAGPGAGRAGRHHARRHRRVGVGRGRLRRRPGRAGSPATTSPATGRSSRPWPATTPASCPPPGSPPRCCSSATRPASRTRPTSTPRPPTASPASRRSPTPWSGWPR